MGSRKSRKYVINLDVSKARNNADKTIQVNVKTSNRTSKKESSDDNKVVKKRNIFINGFFGWENFKWLIREFSKIYSDEPSFFSKKRFESSVGFVIGQAGMIMYLWHNYQVITMSEFLLWAGAEFLIAGYYVNQIQKEKKTNSNEYYINEEDFYEEDTNEQEDTDGDLPMNL